MKLSIIIVGASFTLGSAFQQAPHPKTAFTRHQATASLQEHATKTFVAAVFAASLWAAPASDLPFLGPQSTSTVIAKEMASGSGARVNKDPESLLRLGLPINNKEVRFGFCFAFGVFALPVSSDLLHRKG
jgi:hypothetical protein